jgi:hypothetical protein
VSCDRWTAVHGWNFASHRHVQLPTQLVKVKGKGKVHPRTGHEGPEGEKRYSSILSLISTLDGVGG